MRGLWKNERGCRSRDIVGMNEDESKKRKDREAKTEGPKLSKILDDRKLGGTDRGNNARYMFLPSFSGHDCRGI